jgi:predicted MFS family arabinose efflux permease
MMGRIDVDADFEDRPAKSTVAGNERIVLLVLAAVNFTSIVDFMVIMPLGPRLQQTLGITIDQFGWIVASYTYAAGCAGLVASSLIDRFGRKSAYLTLFTGFLVGTLLCGLAPNYQALLAARVLTGAFGGILGGMGMAIIGDVFPEERRGRATGALMSAFALASVAGVPIGLTLGLKFGWNAPFLILAALGLPVLGLAAWALPDLKGHLTRGKAAHPFDQLKATFSEPNHLRAFALMSALMFGSFAVIPNISNYLVANVGIAQSKLPLVFVLGGAFTLFGAPLSGRMADKYGKLRVYRFIAPVTALMMLAVTNLPAGTPLALAVLIIALMMLCNAGRMVPAMAMITGSATPRLRGGFLSANSAVQHISAGVGASVSTLILDQKTKGGPLIHYDLVGLVGVFTTLLSLWIAGRLRLASSGPPITHDDALSAAARGSVDADEPVGLVETT